MDAIALSMFVEPAVVPGTSSETPPSGMPFGELVAAAATNKQQDVDDSSDAPSDMAASQAGLMSAIVSQWLAQRDSLPSPSLPTFARGILEERASGVPEAAVSADATDEPASPVEALFPTEAGKQAPEVVDGTAAVSDTTQSAMPENDLASDSASPHEASTPVNPRAQGEERRVPIQQLMQYAADIGWTVPGSRTNRAVADTATAAPSEPIEVATVKPQAAPTVTRPDAAFAQQAIDAAANDHASIPTVSDEAPIRDEATDPNPLPPKGTIAADRPHAPERPAQESTRPLESLPQPSHNAPPSTASTPSQATDNIGISSTSNVSTAAENSADMPVKLAVATREGQTAEMQTLALHIAARWAKGESRFTIRLDPPELGRIDVNLNVNSHGHAQAVLAVEKPQTLDLLLRDAPTLERALKDAGLELGGNLSFSLKEEARQHFAQEDQYSSPSRTVELVPTDATKPHVAVNASLVEQLYGSRMSRLDITV